MVRADIDNFRADFCILEAGPKSKEIEKGRQQVKSAKKRYEYSRRDAERLKNLYDTNDTPEEEYLDAAKISYVNAEHVRRIKYYEVNFYY